MKHMIVLVASVIIAFTASAQEKPKDWARFYRYEKANAELAASGAKVDAVFMGNSITDNWAKFDPEFFTNNGFAGRGVSGQTTSQMLVRFRRDVLELNPRVVLIMAGTNDIAQNNGPITLENALGNIKSMCELARLHGIKVILCSVPPAAQFPWRKHIEPAQIIVEFNKMLREYAESQKITYLDYYSSLVDDRGGMPEKWSPDGVHPNKECYVTVMEPLALKAVNKVLKTKKNYISALH